MIGFTEKQNMDSRKRWAGTKIECTWEELEKMNIQKDELAKYIGIKCPFDTALPQNWLDHLVKVSGLPYNSVRYSTFTTYPEDSFGCVFVSAWDEVNKWINKL